jgi:Proto-chlorophyllide reductase 57 kD subunit
MLLAMSSIRWHPDAEARVRKVPFFIRPLVRRRAEAAARERGLAEITSQLLDELKGREHEGS